MTYAVLIPVNSEALTTASTRPVSSSIRRVVAGSPGTPQSGLGTATTLIDVAEPCRSERNENELQFQENFWLKNSCTCVEVVNLEGMYSVLCSSDSVVMRYRSTHSHQRIVETNELKKTNQRVLNRRNGVCFASRSRDSEHSRTDRVTLFTRAESVRVSRAELPIS